MKHIPVIMRLPILLFIIYVLIVSLQQHSILIFIPIVSYLIYDDNRRKLPNEAGIDSILLEKLTDYNGPIWRENVTIRGLRRKQWAIVLNNFIQNGSIPK